MSNQKLSLKQWSDEDKPREKMARLGKKSLSNSELIAILIGSGNNEESAVDLGKRILSSVNNNLMELSKCSIHDLTSSFKGIGDAKAISILAALELGYRMRSESVDSISKINLSQDAFDCISSEIADLSHEEFWVIHLNNNNKVLAKQRVSVGGFTNTVVDTRIIFKTACEKCSTAIILAHNHPSGICKPSSNDILLTKKIKEAARIFDIEVLDHIIVCDGRNNPDSYFSFSDNNIMP